MGLNFVRSGHAVATTDGGHYSSSPDDAVWLLNSPGNIAWARAVDYAFLAIHEVAAIGKAVTTQYFNGLNITRSYWTGCSTGGRQGLMLAQRYPADYDGILASCPPIDPVMAGFDMYWPQVVMNELNAYPPPCEFAAIEAAATQACDNLDGVDDGIIANVDDCVFDPADLVDELIDCNGVSRNISSAAVAVAQAAWDGMRIDDEQIHPGSPPGTSLSSRAGTTCDDNSTNCRGRPNPAGLTTLQYIWKKDPAFDPRNLTRGDFFAAALDTAAEVGALLRADGPDLRRFARRGGKLLSLHGALDDTVSSRVSREYYESVLETDRGARTYYRHFEVPGMQHCRSPPGAAYPDRAFAQLVAWVEDGVVPGFLDAGVMGSDGRVGDGRRKICPYPSRTAFVGDDRNEADSYVCVGRTESED